MRSISALIFSVCALYAAACLYSAPAFAEQPPLVVDQTAYKIEVRSITDDNKRKAVILKISPKENSKLNPEFPTKLNIKAPAGFEFSGESFSGKEFSKHLEKSFEITLPYNDAKAVQSGDLAIEIRFGTCNVVNGQTKSCMMQNWKGNFKLEKT